MSHTRSLAALAATMLFSWGCAKARPIVDDPRACPNWLDAIGPTFDTTCSSCHGPSNSGGPAGGYDTTSYRAALGATASPVVVAGSSSSRLLQVLDPTLAQAPHNTSAISAQFAQIQTWVVSCDARYLDPQKSVHSGGVLNPAQPDFHGALVVASGVAVCQNCHGQDLAGGAAGVSCLSCHSGGLLNPDGTLSCGACHGNPPTTGAHLAHTTAGFLGKSYACSTCHPSHTTAADHAYDSQGVLRTQATVTLGGLAGTTPASGTRAGPPTWDAASQTCKNVYCHGATFADTAAVTNSPSWTMQRTSAQSCTFCHGAPPNGALGTRCWNCHQKVIDDQGNLLDKDSHLNGAIELADSTATCSTCHGYPPPPDLGGNTTVSSLGVGLHQRHVNATSGWSLPIDCSECHRVQGSATTADHFGGGHVAGATGLASVFPAVDGSGTLARTDGATPQWDLSTATCSKVYCHGAGTFLKNDITPSLVQSPTWTSTAAPSPCGRSCHGFPPLMTSGVHTSAAMTNCNGCHSGTVDASGAIIITGAPGSQTTNHMNGVLN